MAKIKKIMAKSGHENQKKARRKGGQGR